ELTMHFELTEYRRDVELDDSVGARRLKRQWELEQGLAFRQLSRLTRLKRLKILDIIPQEEIDYGLDLKLESRGGGLDKLASLIRLKVFNFNYVVQEMSNKEMDWMLKHWPKLEVMDGTFNRELRESEILYGYASDQLEKRRNTYNL
ncbi:hypothetical protein BGX26_005478, partial [Mortierella sp. AD094]